MKRAPKDRSVTGKSKTTASRRGTIIKCCGKKSCSMGKTRSANSTRFLAPWKTKAPVAEIQQVTNQTPLPKTQGAAVPESQQPVTAAKETPPGATVPETKPPDPAVAADTTEAIIISTPESPANGETASIIVTYTTSSAPTETSSSSTSTSTTTTPEPTTTTITVKLK
jgi:hypothetical protein